MHIGKMTCRIVIGERYAMRGLNNIEIKKSVHQIVQTAKLQMPLSLVILNNDEVNRIRLTEKIKEGDKITVEIGYNGNNRQEFSGYIKRVNHKQPLELELEDDLYLMRQLFLKKSFTKVDVRDVLNYLNDELYKKFQVRFKLYDNIPQCTVKNFMINGANGLAVLQELKEKYLLTTYLTNINGEQVLYAGLLYGLKKATVKYKINRNTVNVDNLKYTQAKDQTYKVEIVNQQPNGQVKKYEFGDKGATDTIKPAPISGYRTEAELKYIAQRLIEERKIDGYKGGFEAIMIPYIEPGMVIQLSDPQFKDRGTGNYYTATVTTTFGVNGGRRKPEIDIRLDNE